MQTKWKSAFQHVLPGAAWGNWMHSLGHEKKTRKLPLKTNEKKKAELVECGVVRMLGDRQVVTLAVIFKPLRFDWPSTTVLRRLTELKFSKRHRNSGSTHWQHSGATRQPVQGLIAMYSNWNKWRGHMETSQLTGECWFMKVKVGDVECAIVKRWQTIEDDRRNLSPDLLVFSHGLRV